MRSAIYQCDGCGWVSPPHSYSSPPRGWYRPSISPFSLTARYGPREDFCPTCCARGIPQALQEERERREAEAEARAAREKDQRKKRARWERLLAEQKRERRRAIARGDEPPIAPPPPPGLQGRALSQQTIEILDRMAPPAEESDRVLSQQTLDRMSTHAEERDRVERWARVPLDTSSGGET